jgi:hypothetical protein
VIRETQIIVGAEIDRFARAPWGSDTDAPALRPGQKPLVLCEALRLDVIEGGADVGQKGFGHGASFYEGEAASLAALGRRRYCDSWM